MKRNAFFVGPDPSSQLAESGLEFHVNMAGITIDR